MKMSINGWKYYNHAMIPTGSPDEEVDTSSIENGEIGRDSSGGGTTSCSVDIGLGVRP